MGQMEGGRSDHPFFQAADHPGRRTSTWKIGLAGQEKCGKEL